jgi:hypothetical protein
MHPSGPSDPIHLILIVLFIVCEGLAAINLPNISRPNLGWLGLLFYGLALLF